MPKKNIALGSKQYILEKVDKPEQLQLGLSGRESMPDNQGMLFVFPDYVEQCIWMKDMKFALDILWLDDESKIIFIENNVDPKSYPRQYCHGPAKYVIELNDGEANTNNIAIGQKVHL